MKSCRFRHGPGQKTTFAVQTQPDSKGRFCTYPQGANRRWKTPFARATKNRCEPMQSAAMMEQGTGIEPAFTAWEAVVLPIYEPCKCPYYNRPTPKKQPPFCGSIPTKNAPARCCVHIARFAEFIPQRHTKSAPGGRPQTGKCSHNGETVENLQSALV